MCETNEGKSFKPKSECLTNNKKENKKSIEKNITQEKKIYIIAYLEQGMFCHILLQRADSASGATTLVHRLMTMGGLAGWLAGCLAINASAIFFFAFELFYARGVLKG